MCDAVKQRLLQDKDLAVMFGKGTAVRGNKKGEKSHWWRTVKVVGYLE